MGGVGGPSALPAPETANLPAPHSGPGRREGMGLVAILLVMALLGAWLAWPWLPSTPATGARAAYLPLSHGDASLLVELDQDGAPIAWVSENIIAVPPAAALAGAAPRGIVDNLVAHYPDALEAGTVGDAALYAATLRSIAADGTIGHLRSYILRGPQGDEVIGIHDLDQDLLLTYAPPLLQAPAVLGAESRWQTAGLLGGNFTFAAESQITASGVYSSGSSVWEDCLRVESRLAYSDSTPALIGMDRNQTWVCREMGVVETTVLDETGAPASRRVLAASKRGYAAAQAEWTPPLPAITASGDPLRGQPDEWALTRVARIRPVGANMPSTFPPVYLPTTPPLLLAAAQGGPLMAVDPGDGRARWQFQPGGPIFSQPTLDLEKGLILFGSADKHLYALDLNGLFRWAFAAGDNIAAQPLVAGDLVIAAAEDGYVYALSAGTGALVWQAAVGSPAVSSPALIAEGDKPALVALGSDGGAVLALELETGDVVWQVDADAAVEAPVVYDDGLLFVSAQSGDLLALDAHDGSLRWLATAGAGIRAAPTVAAGLVSVIDLDGRLSAFDRVTGRLRWRSNLRNLAGAPLAVETAAGTVLVVAGSDGQVHALDPSGQVLAAWSAAEARLVTDDAEPSFALAPVLGGGAIWLADGGSVLRRLGVPAAGNALAALNIAWLHTTTQAPLTGGFLETSAIADGATGLLLDHTGALFRLNPPDGSARHLANLPLAGPLSRIDPLLDDQHLYLVSGSTLTAFTRAGWRAQWRVEGSPLSLFPLVRAGDLLLWLSAERQTPNNPRPVRLQALDPMTGELRWRYDVADAALLAGAAATDDTVLIGSPPAAFDLATGRVRWSLDAIGAGIPTVDPVSGLAYLALASPDGLQGAIVALSLADGREQWRTPLSNHLPHPFDRLLLAAGLLIVPTAGDTLIGLDPTSGAVRWTYTPPGHRFGAVAVTGDQLWLLLQDGRLLLVDGATGSLQAISPNLELNLSNASFLQKPLVLDSDNQGRYIVVPTGIAVIGFHLPQ